MREDKAARKKKIIIITRLTGPHYSLQQLFVFEKSHDELLKGGGSTEYTDSMPYQANMNKAQYETFIH